MLFLNYRYIEYLVNKNNEYIFNIILDKFENNFKFMFLKIL